MTTAEEQALIKKLAGNPRAFTAEYSADNRKWFAGKILDFLESQGNPDSDMERLANVLIAAAKKAVNDRVRKGFSTAGLANLWKLYDQLTSRTQIIYGMAAMNPQFLDSANSDYFDFILNRRFRTIQRMAFFVNKNRERKIFGYPKATCSSGNMKVNDNSSTLWVSAGADQLPFLLTGPGKKDLQVTDDTLFIKNDVECNRNLLACDPVAMVLHIDALFEAKDAKKLLNALVAVGDHYVKIDNPLGHFANNMAGQRLAGVTSTAMSSTGTNVEIALGRVGYIIPFAKNSVTADDLKKDAYIPVDGTVWFMIVLGRDHNGFHITGVNPVSKKITVDTLSTKYDAGAKVYVTRTNFPIYQTQPFHLTTDSRPGNALFEQLNLKSEDLQVGDHVYVINHPLYLMYYPTGAWGGEHSFISEIGSRDTTGTVFRNDLKVEGHGLNDTLLGMVNDMLKWINTVLSRFQAITKIHLNNLKANGRKTTANVTFIDPASGASFEFLEYDIQYSYFDYRQSKKVDVTTGFVIQEAAADPRNEFLIFNAENSDSKLTPSIPQPNVQFLIKFTGASFATGQFKPSNWAVAYYNQQSATFETQPLFASDDKTPKQLSFDDLAKSKPFFALDDNADAFVTRPRVNFDATYQTFLKNNGAF